MLLISLHSFDFFHTWTLITKRELKSKVEFLKNIFAQVTFRDSPLGICFEFGAYAFNFGAYKCLSNEYKYIAMNISLDRRKQLFANQIMLYKFYCKRLMPLNSLKLSFQIRKRIWSFTVNCYNDWKLYQHCDNNSCCLLFSFTKNLTLQDYTFHFWQQIFMINFLSLIQEGSIRVTFRTSNCPSLISSNKQEQFFLKKPV